MKNSLFLIGVIGIIGLSATFIKPHGTPAPLPATAALKSGEYILHEWGTFTSIAGKNGVAIDWRPLNGPSDLPSFVYTPASGKGYRGTYGFTGKGDSARVRMETPVIYFYAKDPMEVNVRVRFPEGKITEWYPQASVVNALFEPKRSLNFDTGFKANGINWGTIKLVPGPDPEYLRETAQSHYYPARNTDSTPLQVCDGDQKRIEKEKFLFYRGIGNFTLPLRVRLKNDSLTLDVIEQPKMEENSKSFSLNDLIVFENRGGRVGFNIVPAVSFGQTTVERPNLDKNLTDVYAALENILVARGLYEKEAKAMIETWKSSWFEEGLRVFYILPQSKTDKILPLMSEPKPKEVVRVLVGRTEIITPQMESEVRSRVSRLGSSDAKVRNEAEAALKQHGRFYEPILQSVLENETDPFLKNRIGVLLAVETNQH